MTSKTIQLRFLFASLLGLLNSLPTSNPTPQLIFAPYGDVGSGFDPSALQAIGTSHFTLAFANADCSSFKPVIAQGQELSTLSPLVQKIKAENAILSIGGALQSPSGSMPAVCAAQSYKSAKDLAALYQTYLTNYPGLNWLDFDVEGANIDNTASVDLRSQAIALLQQSNPSVQISLTLPVLRTGLLPNGLNVLQSAKKFGAKINVVNIMAMDYGIPVSDMGQAAIDASTATLSQIASTGLDAHLGITPMIGPNDSAGETFSESDAAMVVSFAAQNDKVAFVSYWSLNRDHGGAFAKVFAPASYSGPSTPSTPPPPPPSSTISSTSTPSHSPVVAQVQLAAAVSDKSTDIQTPDSSSCSVETAVLKCASSTSFSQCVPGPNGGMWVTRDCAVGTTCQVLGSLLGTAFCI